MNILIGMTLTTPWNETSKAPILGNTLYVAWLGSVLGTS